MRRCLLAGLILATSLAGCAVHPREIGREPAMTPVGSALAPEHMVAKSEYYPARPSGNRYSTWTDRAAGLFTANRAIHKGDIVTVRIAIDDRAKLDNKSERNRNSSRSLGLGASFATSGGSAGDIAADGSISSETDYEGSGGTARSETIDLSIAAVVIEELANGNLLIQGSQEVRVNAEMRILTISGIVRPSDIAPDNTVDYERIAEARISYGGRGRITEMQQPPYGQQALDLYLPF
ncbi:flagellar basal body L-ring protein FlgH [Oricola thermophila]|uniref:Flagellar L-ring protein n=1 Tax=Oricola thermophila TaxID=2742145 RepID=A0A6N1VFA8_9HYPH|nr:flagellar basal body L-ring protein FlgH [Oricola thermophila]QKV19640.1 flagellar basal body L-ring protein FlgH [Oricola thermophila]